MGQSNPYILVDTGEGRDEYSHVLEDALKDLSIDIHTTEADISDIILTHRHGDHIGGLPSVLSLLRRRWAERHPDSRSFPAPRIHKMPLSHPQLGTILDYLPPDSFASDASGKRLHDLKEGQTFKITSAELSNSNDSEYSLEVIHTPGHTPDSICLYLPADRALFTADTILGHGSTVFEDLAAYMASLRKMIDFGSGDGSGEQKYDILYPGHGPSVPHTHVAMYLRHRVDRENQVLKVLSSVPPSGDHWTAWTIVKDIYADYPQSLWEPAAHSVDLHLRKLEGEGRIERAGGEGHHTEWEFVE